MHFDLYLTGVQNQPVAQEPAVVKEDSTSVPLPDIRQARRRKEMEEELARMEAEKELNRPKVKRSDKEAFTRVSRLHRISALKLGLVPRS